VAPDGSLIPVASNDVISGALPSLGLALMFHCTASILADDIKLAAADMAEPTLDPDSGFLIATSISLSARRFSESLSTPFCQKSGSRSNPDCTSVFIF
jgi:hypothetical protein